jgi:Lysine-specific metallo-endopeptidase
MTRRAQLLPARRPGQSGGRCACGGTPGPTGECAACRAKRLASEATPGGSRHDFATVGVERKDGVAHGPAGAANRWTDCPASWRPKAIAAQRLGASWVDNVTNGLANLPKPIPAPVATLLTRHFHTTYDKDIAKVVGKYRQIQTAIHSSLDFECETSCDANVLAYVYSVWSNLHVCPYWFNSGAELQAATIVHEIAHDVAGCDDNAYEWQAAKYAGMSVGDAIDNADSYGHFAWDASKPPPSPPAPPAPKPAGP